MAYKGRYKPINPHKYKGNVSNIIYRSGWELKFFRFCDLHSSVLEWSSEEMSIPYVSPIDGKWHRYFPDVILVKKKGEETETWMIEIKPFKQTLPPDMGKKFNTPSGRVSRRFLNEVKTYGVNEAKWAAAERFCETKGWKFAKMTEKELGIK